MTDQPESLTSELDDLDRGEEEGFDWAGLDLRALADPVVLRSLAGVVIALLIMLWPSRTDLVLTRLLGAGLVVMAVSGLWGALRARPRRWLALASALVAVLVGTILLAAGDQSQTVLGRVIGLLLVASGVRDLVVAPRQTDERAWPATKAGALIATGFVVMAFPSEMLASVTVLFALAWGGLGALAIVLSLDARRDGVVSTTDATRLVAEWLAERPKDVEDRQALYAKILYEGPTAHRRMVRFFTLMTFASVIAAMGVIAESTAVVIGAMLIAPLLTPLMGMAMSLVMGWPTRLGRSALVAAGGIVLAVGLGVLLGLIVPASIDPATNGEIASRATPTTIDLIIALAAGAAGAYGLSRPDVSDSLPGVAVAIALVPPLSAAGVSYSHAAWDQGNGALVLFVTNAIAILIMGGVTFVVTGVTPLSRVTENQHRVRTWLAALAGTAAVVFGALLLNGTEVADALFDEGRVTRTVESWLDPYPAHDLVDVELDGSMVTAVVVGPTAGRPPADDLADDLAATLGRTVTADVRLVVEERERAVSGATGG